MDKNPVSSFDWSSLAHYGMLFRNKREWIHDVQNNYAMFKNLSVFLLPAWFFQSFIYENAEQPGGSKDKGRATERASELLVSSPHACCSWGMLDCSLHLDLIQVSHSGTGTHYLQFSRCVNRRLYQNLIPGVQMCVSQVVI